MKTSKVNLARLQVVADVAYHAGEREVPESVAVELKRRGALVEAETVVEAAPEAAPEVAPEVEAKPVKKAAK